ncbi:hypothetical protein NDU88_002655 [Pleurodeles waltl]|uniref:Uncharacterized protein n=1 Tax=Pleurodeles waltl TaxID=8319 RepID=A0AAV7SDJ7_PLEWA|nr:hypothetical protein NDU88_002655 [Pleurodeles waltl]
MRRRGLLLGVEPRTAEEVRGCGSPKPGLSKDYYDPGDQLLFLEDLQPQSMNTATLVRPKEQSANVQSVPPPEEQAVPKQTIISEDEI